MKLSVPFVFEAQVLNPRCKKPKPTFIVDTVTVNIAEVAANHFPAAIKIARGNEEPLQLHYHNKALWKPYLKDVVGEKRTPVSLQTIIKNTETEGRHYRFSCPGAEAPFHNFWHQSTSKSLGSKWLGDDDLLPAKEINRYKVAGHNRKEIIRFARSIASQLLVFEGIVYRKTPEPYFQVITFGLGGNHGGTGLFLTWPYKPKVFTESFEFSLLEKDAAIRYAERVAYNRGDNESIPIKPPHEVTVYLENAVQVNKQKHIVECTESVEA